MKHKPALVVANWKLNPGTAADAKTLAQGVKKLLPKDCQSEVVVAPPFLYIPEVSKVLAKSSIKIAAQTVAREERGALTGEVSATLLSEYGVTYFIIGHSERRAMGETNEQVNARVQAVLKRRLTPVVCIGERERDSQGQFYNFITEQLRSLVVGLTPLQLSKIVIAYEPVWAIGTGVAATTEDVKEMQLFIVSTLTKLFDRKVAEKVKLIYGGSVKSSSASALYQGGGMGGFLVGGASLDPHEFIQIIKATY
jgi:triosephosphate isomerase